MIYVREKEYVEQFYIRREKGKDTTNSYKYNHLKLKGSHNSMTYQLMLDYVCSITTLEVKNMLTSI